MHSTPLVPRRQFVSTLLGATACAGLSSHAQPGRRKAAIIGHTGRGNYGHGLDELFTGLSNVDLVAIADADPDGLAKAAAKTKAARRYLSYREMLEKERPELVSVAPRQSDQHHDMVLAALKAGAHVYVEKPFTTTLAEADALLRVAASGGRKIAVAHQMRLAPQVQHLHQRIREGWIGDIVAMHAHGKQDRRAGGEDMMVLGTHLFDLMRLFAGDAVGCQGWIREKGSIATRAMARPASENIGLVLGDEIEARFEFASGATGTFTSRASLRETLGPWGLKILGSRGAAWVLMDIFPRVFARQLFENGQSQRREVWAPLPEDPSVGIPEGERGFPTANRRVVDDWLKAIEADREPVCGGVAATKAIEMAMAVYESALGGSRCAIPMSKRSHPLSAGA